MDTGVAGRGTARTSAWCMTPIAGGWIADRLLGARRTVLWGNRDRLQPLPDGCTHRATFWLGLLAIALGTGLLKPNISAMVGMLYATEDTRRDAGFTLFYMGSIWARCWHRWSAARWGKVQLAGALAQRVSG